MRTLFLLLVSPVGGGTQARPTDGHSTHSATLRLASYFTLLLALLLGMGLISPAAHAQNYSHQVLHSFTGANGDVTKPYANMINVHGTFYGTTEGDLSFSPNVSADHGSIFSFNPTTNTETTLYRFTGGADGDNPTGGLTYDSGTGKLYGTTGFGTYIGWGGDPFEYTGTIFSFDPSTHIETELHMFEFQGWGAGERPVANMIDVNGTLYGTIAGADYSFIFSFNATTHAENTIFQFPDADPISALIYDSARGKLFGTTAYAIYSINTDGTGYHTELGFDPADGDTPAAGLIEVNGILYGTFEHGGSNGFGTIFSLDPTTHSEQTLYNFPGGAINGAYPQAALTYDSASGLIFGTTEDHANPGLVYAVDPKTGTQTIVYSFQGGTDGALLQAGLLDFYGTLYGTTLSGGTYDHGTIYSLTSPSTTVPVANNDTYAPKYNTAEAVDAPGVFSNDASGGAGPLTATLVTNVTHGTLTLNPDGSFVYTPARGFTGRDRFTYQITNPIGKGNTATVTLSYLAVPPIAHSDQATVQHNTPFVCPAPGILRNDDNSGSPYPMTAVLVTGPSHGTLSLSSNGGFTYTPTTGYSGTDKFTYQAVSAAGTSSIAPVTLTVH